MAERQTKPASSPSNPSQGGLSTAEVIAIVLSVIWIGMAAAYFLLLPSGGESAGFDSLRFVVTLMAIFMPVAMIWVAAAAAKASKIMRDEAQRLQVAIDAMRQTYMADQQNRGPSGLQPTVERKLNEIAKSARQTETALATFATSRDGRRAAVAVTQAQQNDDQPALALGNSVDETLPPLSRADLIRALNFPDTDKDEEGFAALRRALLDHKARQLIQASQDVLTLLSQDGIYMDDMRPDRARPEVWRRFAKGERGKVVASLGGIRDRSSLALSAGRMREDTIFRDTAHHFLRKFDNMLQSLEPEASDEEISDLSETRTARAFMLLGRITGAFD